MELALSGDGLAEGGGPPTGAVSGPALQSFTTPVASPTGFPTVSPTGGLRVGCNPRSGSRLRDPPQDLGDIPKHPATGRGLAG